MTFTRVSKMIMSGEKICNIPLRVCFYARVSTNNDVQLNSLENQLDYYKNYIKSKPLWEYVDGYVDEGVSGVRVEKRIAFKQMINDAKNGKFDLIITKEVSRFARDLEDSIHYIRILKEANVGIYFENQNLNTFDFNSELVLNIMFNLAQDESRKLSSRVKFGHRQAMQKGHVLGSSNITGYKKNNCKLVVDENEAKFIKKLFELYASGEYGFYRLSKKLGELGYYNKKGNLYDKDTLKRIINNPKYKGYYRGKTSEVVDYRTKKRVKISEDNQVIYKCNNDLIPAIVSEELWNKANEILNLRLKNYIGNVFFTGGLKYPLSSKIYCKEHNTNFQRSHGSRKKNRPTWACGMYLQYRFEACASPIITEKDLNNILNSVMNVVIKDKKSIVESMIILYNNISDDNQYRKEIECINNGIRLIEDKKEMLINLVFKNELSKDELRIQFERLKNEFNILTQKKSLILNQINILKRNHDNHNIIAKLIQNEINGGSLDEFIRMFVDEIIVSKIDGDRNNIKLNIFLNLLNEEKVKTKGARHINGFSSDEILYIRDNECNSIEEVKKNKNMNKFTFDVYLKT